MKRAFKIILSLLILIGAIALSVLFISTHYIAVLEPKGLIAMKQRELIITASLLMLIVVIPVFIFTIFFAWKYRESNERAKHTPDWEHNNIAEFCWWGVPMVIIIILGVITYKTTHELNPFRPIRNGNKPLVIQAVALQWKWLFLYPEQGIATVNFVQFPEKTPIDFEITADAPMNSFWIPALGGQIYAMPAMRSKIYLMAEEKGIYKGCSANISGKGFAGMAFHAKASSIEEFQDWVDRVQDSDLTLDRSTYRDLVEPSEYVPVTYFNLSDRDLFEQILKQYNEPNP